MIMNNPSIDDKKGFSEYELRVLDQEWNKRLLQLTRKSPVRAGTFQILFDRSPDLFTIPKLTSYKYRCLGLFKGDQLLGYAMASYQKRYINQTAVDVIYLGNIHVIKRGLGRELLKLLTKRFYNIIPQGTGVEYIYAYIIERNKLAMNLVDYGYLFPRVIAKISMVTILMLLPVKLNNNYKIRRATSSDIESIVALLQKEHSQRLLAPYIDREVFIKNLAERPYLDISDYFVALIENEIVGVCSAWDMTSFKKNRILEYGLKMKVIRLFYNNAARILGVSKLPKTGEAFRDITIAEYAVANRNPKILEALLRYIYSYYRKEGYHSIIIGSSASDPMLKATDIFLSKEILSNVILGAIDKQKTQEIETHPLVYADAIQI
jgi:hypothetical protein